MAINEKIYASVTIRCSCKAFVDEDLLVFSRNNVTITKIFKNYKDFADKEFLLNIQYLEDSELPIKLSNTLMELSIKAFERHKTAVPFYALQQIGTGTIVKK